MGERIRQFCVETMVIFALVLPVILAIGYVTKPIERNEEITAKYLLEEVVTMEYIFWNIPREK